MNINDLRKSLFDTMEKIKTGEISPDQARAITGVGQTLVDLAKTEIQYVDSIGGGESEFMQASKPLPDGVTSIKRHRIK